MADDRAELLRSLTIDRSDGEARPARRRWPARIAGVAILIAATTTVALLALGLRINGRIDQASSQQSTQTPSSSPAPGVEPGRSGSLAASGYVVARRKATVAAEITGKVIEVLVEEGMV